MESATKTSFAIVDMPLAAEPPDLKRYDENDKMDEGGIVGTKPKRTRAARAKGGAGSNVKTEGGESSAGIYLLVDADKKATTVEPENLRGAIARTWMDGTLTLYKAVPVNAEYVVK
jgi:hypothetical protein